jgi:hypothetical protein
MALQYTASTRYELKPPTNNIFAVDVTGDSHAVTLDNQNIFITKVRSFSGKSFDVETPIKLEKGKSYRLTQIGERKIDEKNSNPCIGRIELLPEKYATQLRKKASHQKIGSLATFVAGGVLGLSKKNNNNGNIVVKSKSRPILKLAIIAGVLAGGVEAIRHKQAIDNALTPIKDFAFDSQTVYYATRLTDGSITPTQVQKDLVDKTLNESDWSSKLTPQQTIAARKSLENAVTPYLEHLKKFSRVLANNPSNAALNAATDSAQSFLAIKAKIGMSTMSVTTPAQSTWNDFKKNHYKLKNNNNM